MNLQECYNLGIKLAAVALEYPVVGSKNPDELLHAAMQPDCPPGLLVDLSFSPDARVRRAVAKHPNTPAATAQRLAKTALFDASWAISARMRDAATSLEAGTPAQGGGAAGGVPVEGPTSSEGPAAPIPIPPVLPRII